VKLFTLVLGVAVAIIAWLQWWVALNKLRLDLFDRRYKVYDATRKFLAQIFRHATFDDSQLFEFYAGTSDAEFLFGVDVLEYLTQIRERAVDMRTAMQLFEPLPVGVERSRHVQAHHDQLSWLNQQITAMTSVFAPYLGFANIRLRVMPSL
jgi:4-amino-4-deoxy-L-arabinose transferase-like glycosyltransferase